MGSATNIIDYDDTQRKIFSDFEQSISSFYSTTAVTDRMQIVNGCDIRSKDVLCGRDKVALGHSGNRRFQVIIAMNREKYQTPNSSKDDKTKIILDIVRLVQESGGRFLKRCDEEDEFCCWYVVSDHYAREKVSHALRRCRKNTNKRTAHLRKKKKIQCQTKSIPAEESESRFDKLLLAQESVFKDLINCLN